MGLFGTIPEEKGFVSTHILHKILEIFIVIYRAYAPGSALITWCILLVLNIAVGNSTGVGSPPEGIIFIPGILKGGDSFTGSSCGVAIAIQ